MKTYDAFPEPVGSYTVGRTQMGLEYTPADHSPRELTAFVYYPSDSSEGKAASAYMFPEVYDMLQDQPLVTGYLTGDFFSIEFKPRCYDDLALSAKEQRYPVLFILCLRWGRLPGMGNGDLYGPGQLGICCGQHRPSG